MPRKMISGVYCGWAGFSNGRLDVIQIDDGWGGFGDHTRKSPAIFSSKREAQKCYEDVRFIQIAVEAKP